MQIILATLVLGGIGLIFGVLLTVASKKFHVEVDPRIEEVSSYLAGANCGACGYPGCDACAQAVVEGKAGADCCPPGGVRAAEGIAKVMGLDAGSLVPMVARVLCQGNIGVAQDRYIYDGYRSCLAAAGIAGGPKACHFACIGLGDCVDQCAFGAVAIKGGVAWIDAAKCTGCGKCVDACPRSVISLFPMDAKVLVRCRNMEPAKLANAECMRSCIGCSRCVRTCKYDAIQVVDGFAHIDLDKCTRCGDCAEVCPRKCIVVT